LQTAYLPQWGTCPTVTPFADTAICLGNSAVIWAPAAPAYLGSPLHYTWSTGDTTLTLAVTPQQTTNYVCTISDGIQSYSDTIQIRVDTIAQNFMAIDTVFSCSTQTYLDAATGYDSYAWSSGQTNASFQPQGSGRYTCTVTHGACSTTDTIIYLYAGITQNDTALCDGQPIMLSHETISEMGLLGYWSFSGNYDNSVNGGIQANFYNVTLDTSRSGIASNALGITSKESKITLPAQNSAGITISMWYYYNGTGGNWNTLACYDAGNHHHIIISPSGELGYFNGGFFGSGFSPQQRHWYHLVLVKENTMSKLYVDGILIQSSSQSFNNHDYPVSIIGNFVNGQGALGKIDDLLLYNRALSATELSLLFINHTHQDIFTHFSWNTTDTNSSINVTPAQTTTYYCTVNNGNSSCTDSVTVTVNPLSTNFFTQDTLKVCNNSTTLIAPSNGSYSWSNGSTAQSITVNNTGWYACMFTNSNGCTSSDSVFVQLSSPSSATNNATACGSYTWPANGQSYTQSGTYTRTSLNASGCTQADTLQLNIQVCQTELHLGCLLDGYYDGNAGMVPVLQNQGEATTAGACDTIHVELHSDTAPYLLETSTNTVLQQNGTAICIFPYQTGSKYIVVKHRNAIETWSAQPINMGAVVNYDFRTSASKAYANNQVDVSGNGTIWALFTGDINQDQNVDLLDMPILEEDIALYMFGYTATDLNGDGNTDLLDVIYLDYGIANYVFSYHP
jgi:hypothetical protein